MNHSKHSERLNLPDSCLPTTINSFLIVFLWLFFRWGSAVFLTFLTKISMILIKLQRILKNICCFMKIKI